MDKSRHYISLPLYDYEMSLVLFDIKEHAESLSDFIAVFWELYHDVDENVFSKRPTMKAKRVLVEEYLNLDGFVKENEFGGMEGSHALTALIDFLTPWLMDDCNAGKKEQVFRKDDLDFRKILNDFITGQYDVLVNKYNDCRQRNNSEKKIADITSVNQVFIPYDEYAEFNNVGNEIKTCLENIKVQKENMVIPTTPSAIVDFNIFASYFLEWVIKFYNDMKRKNTDDKNKDILWKTSRQGLKETGH